MSVLVVIPARGGSKGVPGKNVASVGGVPLVARAVHAAVASGVGTVTVSTDDDRIADAASVAGASVTRRPDELAGDAASSESVLLHALDEHRNRTGQDAEVLVMVQCTSPFLTASEIADCVAAVEAGADSAFTAAPSHGFLWQRDDAGDAVGVNHDKATRPRRQDRTPEFLETGAVYAMRADGFRRSRHRFFGRTVLIETDPARVLEIDEPDDLERSRLLAPVLDADASAPHRTDLDAVVLDFDGTQTDDAVLVASDGSEQVRVHRGDGLGIAALRRSGLPVLILSSETNPVVRARARKLGVPVLHGVDDKATVLRDWCAREGVDPARVLYAGNDVNDLGCFSVVGWPIAVASAHPVVRERARLVTSVPGGHGAIREIASWILGKDLAS
ncbi:acylneuraminate cytidylyltransferase [Micropruina sp.]|uniref:acylneuraminate cytidylyltransferase n=1 Tax=Micropruina sp. TaxID=2737536 RepID=UPI00261BC3F1|nr:acylneuraminate cytidylyltransferase [Micropruina sp.]